MIDQVKDCFLRGQKSEFHEILRRDWGTDSGLLSIGIEIVRQLIEEQELVVAKWCIESIRAYDGVDCNSNAWKLDEIEAWINMEEGSIEEGVKLMEKVAEKGKEDREFWYRYAQMLKRVGSHRKAIFCVLKAVELSPDWGKAEFLAAQIHQELGEDEYAIHFFNSAIRHGEREKVVLEASSFSYLRSQRYDEGWQLFENRPKSWNLEWLNADWEYGNSLDNKSVVVIADEGIGDVIMFAPLLRKMAEAASEHVVYCDERLKSLVKRSIPELKIESQILDNRFRDYEMRIRLASLASIYWRDLDSIKDQKGYLKVCDKKHAYWQSWLKEDRKVLSVGIAWEGGAHDAKEKARRSIELGEWKELLEDTTVSWVSLQKDPCVDKIVKSVGDTANIRIPEGATQNIDELAALVSCLDLVITCEQTVAHIAGGVGIKTIVITGNPKGWRYVSRSPTNNQMVWYSNVGLVSRNRPNFWQVCRRSIAEAKIEAENMY